MTSHYNIITPSSATFVYTDLFINDTIETYEVPRMLHIVNESSTTTVINLISKAEDGSLNTGIALPPDDAIDLDGFSFYKIGVKYEASAGSGDLIVSGYNYHLVTK